MIKDETKLLEFDFVNQIDRLKISNWVASNFISGKLLKNSVSNNRYYSPITKLNNVPIEIETLKSKIINFLDLKLPVIDEPVYGSFVSYQLHGGSVHSHIDQNKEGFRHIRINVIISKPESGGNPIINDVEYNIEEGSGWAFFPDKNIHSSSENIGHKPRITCSFGFLIPEVDVN